MNNRIPKKDAAPRKKRKGQFKRTWYSPEVLEYCEQMQIDAQNFVESAAHTLALANPTSLIIRKAE